MLAYEDGVLYYPNTVDKKKHIRDRKITKILE